MNKSLSLALFAELAIKSCQFVQRIAVSVRLALSLVRSRAALPEITGSLCPVPPAPYRPRALHTRHFSLAD